jgi:7,8-dihydropterin-6-yl-methyl-4-(beta-D-ribofuranosyl)aminobenzene 5'-phosphate synthase
MKLIQSSLIIMMFFSLAACNPAHETPVESVSPRATLQVDTPSPLKQTIVPSPIVTEGSTPTYPASPITVTKMPDEGTDFPRLGTPKLTITIVYDNLPYDQRLSTAWGFSALVEYGDHTLLFDTGGDGQLLMQNMRILGIDPQKIESVVLSHAHDDHTGGLFTLLSAGAKPVVYLLPSFPASFTRQVEQYTKVNEVSPGQSLAEGIWTSGEIGGLIPEQALVINTEQGLVVITGCAHPGIVAILEQIRDRFNEPIHLVLGGFHLGSQSESEINAILIDFRRLDIEQVGPCHCTGDQAIGMFAVEYGEDFLPIGVGSVITLEIKALK